MQLKVYKNSQELGIAAAKHAAQILNKAIKEKGHARILLSTGASQFDFFSAFVKEQVDWSALVVFHLEYGLFHYEFFSKS